MLIIIIYKIQDKPARHAMVLAAHVYPHAPPVTVVHPARNGIDFSMTWLPSALARPFYGYLLR
jgi:hypothetical protein